MMSGDVTAFQNSTVATNSAVSTAVDSWTQSDPGVPDTDTGNPSCYTWEFVWKAVFGGILFLLGVIGNSLSVAIMWPARKKNAFSLMLIALAFFDTGVLFVWFINSSPLAVCRYFNLSCTYYKEWVYPRMAELWNMGTIFHMSSTWMVVLVGVHRYLAVRFPLKSKAWGTVRMAQIQVCGVGAFFAFFCLPRWFRNDVKKSEDGSKLVRKVTALGENEDWELAYDVILYYVVQYVIPFSTLILCSVKLIRVLRKTRAKRERMTKSKREEEGITMTLVVVVITFMVCQIMNPIRRALAFTLPPSERLCGSTYAYYNLLSTFFVQLNAACNFVIYFLFGPRFRKDLMRKLGIRGRQIDPSTLENSLTMTRTAAPDHTQHI